MKPYTLPDLAYDYAALEPHYSARVLKLHHDKHHKAYVDTLNQLVGGTDDENASLEDIIVKAEGKLFNQAAQVWNHTLYWNSMAPGGGGAQLLGARLEGAAKETGFRRRRAEVAGAHR